MKTQRVFSSLSFLLAFVILAAGCVSTKPEKFAMQVHQWVPIGTSAKEAERIMTRKGFECHTWSKNSPFNRFGIEYMGCEREQVMMHDWSVRLFLDDGQVIGYGPVMVDDVPAISAP
ncbi:MAG TPA: hypothetical protein VK327_00225 [Candidatus Paceibacterota bacterium]|nr:hypothetical protein [Candidatus Paceibacterota bacterium]